MKKIRKRKVIKRGTPAPSSFKKQTTDPFLIQIPVFMGVFILIIFLTVLYFDRQALKIRQILPAAPAGTPAEQYKNPEFEKMKKLAAGGKLEKTLPVQGNLKFTMSDEPVFKGIDPIYSLNVCCPGGLSKDFYTAKMPWAFIMYEFEPGIPTVTIFEINSAKKTARFEIVVMDPQADISAIKEINVRIFAELLKEYKPGFEWRGSVRQEIN